jgi:hypothetical protein
MLKYVALLLNNLFADLRTLLSYVSLLNLQLIESTQLLNGINTVIHENNKIV